MPSTLRTVYVLHDRSSDLRVNCKDYSRTSTHLIETLTQFHTQLTTMATAVKMDEETKSKLEELQAEIKLKTGEKVTQQEILERLIASAIQSRAEFIDSFRDSTDALSADEIDQFNAGMISSGVETDEDDIDEILYG